MGVEQGIEEVYPGRGAVKQDFPAAQTRSPIEANYLMEPISAWRELPFETIGPNETQAAFLEVSDRFTVSSDYEQEFFQKSKHGAHTVISLDHSEHMLCCAMP